MGIRASDMYAFGSSDCFRCSALITVAWWARGLLQLRATSKIHSFNTWLVKARGEPHLLTGALCSCFVLLILISSTLQSTAMPVKSIVRIYRLKSFSLHSVRSAGVLLLNLSRGYYLRWRAVDNCIRNFLHVTTNCPRRQASQHHWSNMFLGNSSEVLINTTVYFHVSACLDEFVCFIFISIFVGFECFNSVISQFRINEV